MRLCSSATSGLALVVMIAKRAQHAAIRPAETFPDAGKRHRLSILPGDGVGLLAALHDPPFVEHVRWHDAPAPGERSAERRPDFATVSARALIGVATASVSRCHHRTRPHCSRSRWRSPVSGWRRTTGASCVGARFHVGAKFGSGFRVPKMRAGASAGRKLAYRPHIPGS